MCIIYIYLSLSFLITSLMFNSHQVCLYSSYDVVCWVPLGGIAGSGVGFIRSGERRTLTLPRPWRHSEAEQDATGAGAPGGRFGDRGRDENCGKIGGKWWNLGKNHGKNHGKLQIQIN